MQQSSTDNHHANKQRVLAAFLQTVLLGMAFACELLAVSSYQGSAGTGKWIPLWWLRIMELVATHAAHVRQDGMGLARSSSRWVSRQ